MGNSSRRDDLASIRRISETHCRSVAVRNQPAGKRRSALQRVRQEVDVGRMAPALRTRKRTDPLRRSCAKVIGESSALDSVPERFRADLSVSIVAEERRKWSCRVCRLGDSEESVQDVAQRLRAAVGLTVLKQELFQR
jgi:hypothetical protein